MHISEGVLSAPVLLTGAVLSLIGLTLGLRKIKNEDIPKVAVLSSAFFVASLIHIPIGPTSAHLVLNGLVGMLLGWAAFPSIFVALVLQALLFQFGGLTTLGVNTFAMAMPGVLLYYVFRKMLQKGKNLAFLGGFLGGFLALLVAAFFISIALMETEKSFVGIAGTLLVMHLPIALIEGIITGFVVVYLKKVKPEALIC
ncbi:MULTISPECIES: cobalt transporter CbiM [Thermodesulfovibrio]|uniref:CbiM n=1 Tax=Thermodesulfovibrio yellowstonii (strain ATCC 51303 / DSM 11347 / YP87) TaxID=289376 RepID=B5YI79_THEYD|nr:MULTISPECIES: cobalt transporter CbiM [Thermodesulfovibrio]ACI21594.1 CbiM [Thermodesulfovibrio yellowstonii DSM 11347]MDI6864565.1 cobalt transporter CbiM [Thermodesulfovibrio yellowstonii]